MVFVWKKNQQSHAIICMSYGSDDSYSVFFYCIERCAFRFKRVNLNRLYAMNINSKHTHRSMNNMNKFARFCFYWFHDYFFFSFLFVVYRIKESLQWDENMWKTLFFMGISLIRTGSGAKFLNYLYLIWCKQ